MRTPFVAGNWKMFKTVADARHLVSELVPGLQPLHGVEKVLVPPFTALLAVAALLEGTDIGIGAQNMHWELSGAFTGEISPSMVAELCHYVVLGHSERRKYFGESDAGVNRKIQAALAQGLVPIVCVGETLDEYEAGKTAQVVGSQIRQGFAGLNTSLDVSNADSLVVAYEPVWAIGTGKTATPQMAQEVHAFLRGRLAARHAAAATQIQILYGGSMKPDNAADLLAMEDIDGGLIGGAALKAADFLAIIHAAA